MVSISLKEFNKAFKYTPDKGEDWSIPTLVDGRYRNDCDGYMLAIIYLVEDFKDVKKDVWFCRVNGAGHVVTETPEGFIDNNYRSLVPKYMLRGYTDFRRVYTIEIKFKMFMSKIGFYKLIHKVKGLL